MPTGATVGQFAPEGAKKSFFRPDIQGLRAVAVLAVILNHLLGWPSGGFVGVDMFFVISGFLITGLLLREEQKTGTISFTGFYTRRAKRILPAALLVTVVTVAASWFLTPGPRFLATTWDAVWATLFVANWNFAIQGTDYFQQDLLPSPLQHFWSLSVEEQFYFVWPWLMLGIYALAARKLHWSRQTTVSAIAGVMAALVAASFGYALFLTATDTNFAYFSSLGRAWELGVGSLAAILLPFIRIRSLAVRTIAIWVGMAGLVASVFLIDEALGFPAPAAALPVAATVLIIIAGDNDGHRFAWPLTNPVSRYLGDISYSLYLWHFPVIILLLAVLPSGTPLYYAVAVTLIGIFSVGSYHLVEDPLRRATWAPSKRHRRRRRSRTHRNVLIRNTLVLGSAIALAATTVSLVYIREAEIEAQAAEIIASQDRGDSPAAAPTVDPREACAGAPVMVDPSCARIDLGSELAPAPADAATDYGPYSDECWTPEGRELRLCEFGMRSDPAVRVAIAGDSHASHLLPALVGELEALNWSLDTYVGDSCLVTTEVFEKCATMQPRIIESLTNGDYDLVLVTASRNKAVDTSQYATTLESIAAAGKKVLVIGDNPKVSQDALLCFQRVGFDPSTSGCGTEESASPTDPLLEVAYAAGVPLLDLTDLYCSDGWCPSIIGGIIVYRDAGSHLTATFAKSMSPTLVQRIQQAAGV